MCVVCVCVCVCGCVCRVCVYICVCGACECMYSDGVMVYSRGGCDHFRDKGWYLLRCGAMYCLESLGGVGGGGGGGVK